MVMLIEAVFAVVQVRNFPTWQTEFYTCFLYLPEEFLIQYVYIPWLAARAHQASRPVETTTHTAAPITFHRH
jgi:hypothetical protein